MSETSVEAPPTDRPEAVRWLLSRHPDVERLLRRFGPDAVEAAFTLPQVFDDDAAADREWREYQDRYPRPQDEGEYERWRADGPPVSPAVEILGVLSGGELRAVRMVAAITGRVPIGIGDLYGVDFPSSNSNFVNDWLQVVATGAGRW